MQRQAQLDWAPHFDERSREFPIRQLLRHDKPRSYTWRCDQYLDQGVEGACVGFGWAHEIAARPKVHPATTNLAQHIYNEAKKVDYWAGEDYEGTSVLAGAKVAQKAGYYEKYRWAFTLEDILVSLGYHGPVVIGVNWYEGMDNTDKDGRIHVTGRVVGGHGAILKGISVKDRTVRLHNSWGPRWGVNGDAYLSWDDLDKLRKDQGEFCVPTRL